ncbi:MAG: class I SAM-dependent methyltransferase [archaeon]
MKNVPKRQPELADPILDAIYRDAALSLAKDIDIFYQDRAEEIKMLSSHGNISKLVEVGCGDGGLAYHVARRLDKTEVIAEDVDPIAISEAKKRFSAPNLTYQVGSVYSLSKRHKDLDRVVVKDSFHHFDDLRSALKQINSSLKHEGGLIGWDLGRDRFYNELCIKNPDFEKLATEIQEKRRKSREKAIEFLESLGPKGNAIMSYQAAYTYKEMKRTLTNTGFDVLMIGPDEKRGYGLFAVKVKPGTKSDILLMPCL